MVEKFHEHTDALLSTKGLPLYVESLTCSDLGRAKDTLSVLKRCAVMIVMRSNLLEADGLDEARGALLAAEGLTLELHAAVGAVCPAHDALRCRILRDVVRLIDRIGPARRTGRDTRSCMPLHLTLETAAAGDGGHRMTLAMLGRTGRGLRVPGRPLHTLLNASMANLCTRSGLACHIKTGGRRRGLAPYIESRRDLGKGGHLKDAGELRSGAQFKLSVACIIKDTPPIVKWSGPSNRCLGTAVMTCTPCTLILMLNGAFALEVKVGTAVMTWGPR
mmetsp:Transcript_26507/g.76092  ORF Transcript_26507/g.76092 Transcript_26507/m.76092 type:complete len:276 (+) Transcript_26507:521-1348(+)